MNYLDRNDTAYAEYLNWRLLDPSQLYGYKISAGLCSLCKKLVDYNYTENNIHEQARNCDWIHKWYYESEDAECWNKTEHLNL